MISHEAWMQQALNLAKTTTGQTSPNPMVGAIVVKDGCLVGMGAHLKAGTPHAEVHALEMAGSNAKDSTLYVTLEPCHHHGRTPPCTEKIISTGVKQVVIGCQDPDPRVAGKGIKRLEEAGIQVITGILEKECRQVNEAYFYHRQTGYPFVTLKTASTLDGRIATASGHSKWITHSQSRLRVHQLRHQHQAILVGIGTVLADNPQLTTRLPNGGLNPLRVIVDSRLRIPLDARITDVSEADTLIFTTEARDQQKEDALRSKGVKVIIAGKGPRVDWELVFRTLGNQGILSVLVEGGSEVNASLLEENWVNKAVIFLAPKLLGGSGSLHSIGGKNPETISEAKNLKDLTIERYGDDICIIGYL